MRKTLLALMALIITLSFSACDGSVPGSTPSDPVDVSPPVISPAPESPDITAPPENTETPPPESSPDISNEEAIEIFRGFLSVNFERLSEASFNSIAGIGFLDLDLDGTLEMILFDAGASASMGANVFDIIDGGVHCVSSSIAAIGEIFGDAELSEISISANFMENFRLMEEAETGERFFVVESSNGNIDSSFSELIRFGNEEGRLTLSSVFYKYEEYDVETRQVTHQEFRVGSTEALLSGYTSFVDNFYADNSDLQLECLGAFVWEITDYVENRESFMILTDMALELSKANVLPQE